MRLKCVFCLQFETVIALLKYVHFSEISIAYLMEIMLTF